MDDIFTKFSFLVQEQFPDFYLEEGSAFVDFMRLYYEWMEQIGNPLEISRNFGQYQDVDTTIDKFITHFENVYLTGLPQPAIDDPAFFIKHVQDVYRSKGTIRGFKLLFRLLYNQNIDVYLPQIDIFKPSDNIWYAPNYIILEHSEQNSLLYGRFIQGLTSGATAFVDDFITRDVNKLIDVLFLSNITGQFEYNEKIIDTVYLANSASMKLPTNIGAITSIYMENGGQNFSVGDILVPISGSGIEAQFRVDSVRTGGGTVNYTIIDGGNYYSLNATPIITRTSNSGYNTSFKVGGLSSIHTMILNTDILYGYVNVQLNANDYGFRANSITNASSNISASLTYNPYNLGKVVRLKDINTGNNYSSNPQVTLRDLIFTNKLPGNVTTTSASNIITGNGTQFSTYFYANSFIKITDSHGKSDTRIVKSVTNNTSMVLDDIPLVYADGTSNSSFKYGYPILAANFGSVVINSWNNDGTTPGENANIAAYASYGNGIINAVSVKASGIGYIDNEELELVRFGALANTVILSGGVGYSNNEVLLFTGGSPSRVATGSVLTNSNGTITSLNISYQGSGYLYVPEITVVSKNGSGAILSTAIGGIDDSYNLQGRITLGAMGISSGSWKNKKSFPNSDKYIQDSYYYQDMSYEIRASIQIQKYGDIIKKVAHPAGFEMFGKYTLIDYSNTSINVVSESFTQV